MEKNAIAVQNLCKEYRIGQFSSYNTISEIVSDSFKAITFRKNKKAPKKFLAIDNISFNVEPGEIVGIIGRNGAGKSTLLKILSRITFPTKGTVKIHGRVGSLLEVGTGFHPELTGRENVYLSGSILGMKKCEIEQKFDEIIKFSEIEQFIDTPVKRFSSGMYVRLAFAVAAHLEPEILLVDEVLAVGDMQFQKKCLGKMKEVGSEGRTVLFISHNMTAITRLCPRTILMDSGKIIFDGLSTDAVGLYLSNGLGTKSERNWEDYETRPGNDIVKLKAVRVLNESGEITASLDIRKPIGVEIEFDVLKPGYVLVPNLHFFNEEGTYLFISHDFQSEWRTKIREVGRFSSTAWIPGNLLSEGTVIVGAAVSSYYPLQVHFYEREAVAFQVFDTFDGNSARGDFAGPLPGAFRPLLNWTTSFTKL